MITICCPSKEDAATAKLLPMVMPIGTHITRTGLLHIVHKQRSN